MASKFFEAWETKSGSALVRHDLKIVAGTLRFIRGKPSDILIFVGGIPLLLLFARAWVAGLPDRIVSLQSAGFGLLVAFYSAKAIIDRCAYHRTVGPLAAHAQRASELFAFALPFLFASQACGLLLLVILGSHHVGAWLVGATAGFVAASGWARISCELQGRKFPALAWRGPFPRLSRYAALRIAATGAALGAALTALPEKASVTTAIAATCAVLASLVMGRIDADTIRFRTIIGDTSGKLVRAHIGRLALFLLSFAATLSLTRNWPAVAATAMIGTAAGALIALRVLALQSFGRRAAEWIVAAIIATTALIGMLFPPLVLLSFTAVLIWLTQRAHERRWLIP